MIHVLRIYEGDVPVKGGVVRQKDHVKVSVRINDADPEDVQKVLDEFERAIRERGLTEKVIEAPVTVGSATGVIAAVDLNNALGRRLSSGGEWVVR